MGGRGHELAVAAGTANDCRTLEELRARADAQGGDLMVPSAEKYEEQGVRERVIAEHGRRGGRGARVTVPAEMPRETSRIAGRLWETDCIL